MLLYTIWLVLLGCLDLPIGFNCYAGVSTACTCMQVGQPFANLEFKSLHLGRSYARSWLGERKCFSMVCDSGEKRGVAGQGTNFCAHTRTHKQCKQSVAVLGALSLRCVAQSPRVPVGICSETCSPACCCFLDTTGGHELASMGCGGHANASVPFAGVASWTPKVCKIIAQSHPK